MEKGEGLRATAKLFFIFFSVISLIFGGIVASRELLLAGVGWAVLAAAVSPRITIILRDGFRMEANDDQA